MVTVRHRPTVDKLMTVQHRVVFALLVLLAAAATTLYAYLGTYRPHLEWKWVDIIGEGGTALMAMCWLHLILDSRPGGRVTALLASGLAAIALGAWLDCLDEFFILPAAMTWDNWLESLLLPGGMLTLTVGIYFWREEQFSLNEHMHKRERLFREHRGYDRVTQLADAAYLRRQLKIERSLDIGKAAALVMIDIDRFHLVNREYGTREGDRLLQAVSHVLLLNARRQDLVCRYAGDRFAVLMPATSQAQAERRASELRSAVAALRHYPAEGDKPLMVSVRTVCGSANAEPEQLLSGLDASLETGPVAFGKA